jgi:hypothetical protein
VVGYSLRRASETTDRPDPVSEARVEDERVDEERGETRVRV